MARISGVEIPNDKRVIIALTYIFGIGKASSRKILEKANVDENLRVKSLEEAKLNSIKKVISEDYQIEGDLRTKVQLNIKRLIDIGSYLGKRHRMSLPVHGQRTRTNARTRKGKKRTVAGRKKAPT